MTETEMNTRNGRDIMRAEYEIYVGIVPVHFSAAKIATSANAATNTRPTSLFGATSSFILSIALTAYPFTLSESTLVRRMNMPMTSA